MVSEDKSTAKERLDRDRTKVCLSDDTFTGLLKLTSSVTSTPAALSLAQHPHMPNAT